MRRSKVILTVNSLDAEIAPKVKVRDFLARFKRMRLLGYFSLIYLGNGRHVSVGTEQYGWPVRESECFNFTRMISCFPDPVWFQGRNGWTTNRSVWTVDVTLRGDSRYYSVVEDKGALDAIEDEDELRADWRTAWYDEDLVSVRVRSSESLSAFKRDIQSFMAAFTKAEAKVRNASLWRDCGLEVTILCRCGHVVTIEAQKLSSKPCDDIFALRPSLRCSACGEKGQAEILPTFRKGLYAPTQAGYYTKGNGVRDLYDDSEEVDLYKVLAGDGTNDVYLGDGSYIDPFGKISDR